MARALSILLALVLMAGSALGAARRRSGLLDYLFLEQRLAVEDPSSKKTLWCTGRAGKTTAVITDFIDDGLKHDHYRYIYVGKTLESAMEIAWPVAKEIDREFKLNLDFSESRNRITIPSSKSWIKVYGADRPGWMDKLYGQKWRRLGIDEAGFYTIDLRAFIEDVVEMRGADLGGQIYLLSIPGRLPRGLFHDVIKGFDGFEIRAGEQSPSEPGWSVHSWTWRQNPTVQKQIADLIARKKRDNPDIVNSPDYRRNYLGETVIERGERVYNFDEQLNTFKGTWEPREGDNYVLGLDFGWDDCWGFSLICYRDDSPTLVEVESYSESNLMMDKAAAIVTSYIEAYPNLSIVADPQFKAYFEEFRRRYDLPIMPAEKANKWDWIEIINGDLEAGRIKIVEPKTSPHVDEMNELVWKIMRTGKKIEMPGKKNDCCDAFNYAFRHAYHYRFEEEPATPDPGTREWYEQQEKEIIDELIRQDEINEEPWYG